MKQKDGKEFYWPGMFIVTSFSFFLFSGLTKLMNGSPSHSGLFLKIGIASFALYGLSYTANLSVKAAEKKKSNLSRSRRNRMLNY